MSKIEWLKLDNVGKIFPATLSSKNTGVFRLACELQESVEPALLQEALNEAIKKFPHFLCILKNGFFWYYLESCEIAPIVHIENREICAGLFKKNKTNLLFDVSYLGSRINLEVYHVLADGTGAVEFMQTLVYEYLTRRHKNEIDVPPNLTVNTPVSRRSNDSFSKYYKKQSVSGSASSKHAYRIKGTPCSHYRLVEGIISCTEVRKLAKQFDVSVTILMCSVLVMAIRAEMSVSEISKKEIAIAVPVNLRKYFPSESARNFFENIIISDSFPEKEEALPEIISKVKKIFEQELTQENLSKKITKFMNIEKNIFAKLTPLPVKNFFMKAARDIEDTKETAVISNLGIIHMPEEISQWIHLMSVSSSTAKIQVNICSFHDYLTVSITSFFQEVDIQRTFFRILASLGLDIQIRTNFSVN